MFLKSVELYGFKSFADRTKFEFTDGITSLLGPNGSGKSNVVDSIKWVLGTQAPSAIRASKREDVIFNGTDFRKPMPMCEVILTLNNEENLLNIDAAEVEIKRRMFRSGDTEYYINRTRARLRDVKELFMDTGVGKAAYSILEQGKIDQILSVKPEDRRYIFEEAAGISRFKQDSDEATRKLQKTDENMQQVSILYHDSERRYNSLKVQVERVQKSRELKARQETLEIELQLSYVQSLGKFREQSGASLAAKEDEYARIDALLSSKSSDLERQNAELETLRQERDAAGENLHRAEERKTAAGRELDLLNERWRDVHNRTLEARFKARQVQDRLEAERQNFAGKQADLERLRQNVRQTQDAIKKTAAEIAEIEKTRGQYAAETEALNAESERLAARQMEITQSISELANNIADRLEQNIKGSGYSTAARSKAEKALFAGLSRANTVLGERLDFLRNLSKVDFENDVFLKALDDADEAIRTELDEIKGLFQEYSGTIPTFLDEFTAPEGILARKSQLDSELEKTYKREAETKERIQSLNAEAERLGNMLILKESDLNDLRVEESQFAATAQSLSIQISEMENSLKQTEFEFSDASHSIEAEVSNENEALEKIDQAKERSAAIDDMISQYRLDLDAVIHRIDSKNEEIIRHNTEFQEQFARKQVLMTEIAKGKADLENLDGQIQKVYTDFFDATGKSLREFNDHEITAPVDALKTELASVKKKIGDMGYINYMAEDDFNEAKKNYEFYSKNMEDLTKAKEDLEEVIAQIRQKSEELFLDTYNKISVAFTDMFTTLFGGGRAELTLSDEESVLESGIEILAQPPGKKLTTLSLLSGGEKSMTAVALLFATYKVKPSPFCILDEIDAALDARNVGAFMKALEQFGGKSQFIIITHNRHTVMGSNSLLGVTQQELGVSKMISYRIDEAEDTSGTEATLKG